MFAYIKSKYGISKGTVENFPGIEFVEEDSERKIDSDLYWNFVTGNIVKSGESGGLVPVETKFGWILSGCVDVGGKRQSVNFVSSVTGEVRIGGENDELESQVKRFWELESLGIKKFEQSFYEEYLNTISRNEYNRYEVRLPFKENHPLIHDNFALCKRRLLTLHRKLKDNPDLLKGYNNIFIEQKQNEIIEEVMSPGKPGETHYIPHHPVIRGDKTTTKIRIVFDACARDNGPSLNDCLYKGPHLTPLLYDILLRFRSHVVALTSDIEKAFLQINVNANDRDYLRFLWFDNILPDQPKIVRNRFARVVFAVTSLPFCLNGTIRKHVQSYDFDKEFIDKVLSSFFVDDFIGREESVAKAFELFKKLRIRFLEGHFLSRKWKTNNLKVPDLINHNNSGNEDAINKVEKVLGIPWDNDEDILVYDFKTIMKDAHKSKPTKRNLLKIISSFYDPIGLIQPIMISLKILLQEAHRLKLGWDDEFCGEIKEAWERNFREIDELVNVNVDRGFESSSYKDPIVCRELHGFSDASKSGFGACVYVRSFCRSGKVTVRLLIAKSRVAPLKTETIPRLELLGNLLLSPLTTSVKSALKNCVNFDNIYLWTDSKVTLS